MDENGLAGSARARSESSPIYCVLPPSAGLFSLNSTENAAAPSEHPRHHASILDCASSILHLRIHPQPADLRIRWCDWMRTTCAILNALPILVHTSTRPFSFPPVSHTVRRASCEGRASSAFTAQPTYPHDLRRHKRSRCSSNPSARIKQKTNPKTKEKIPAWW